MAGARRGRQGDRQIPCFQRDQLGGILGRSKAVGDNQGNSLADMADAALRQNRPFGGGAFGSVAIHDGCEMHAQNNTRGHQILGGKNQMHAGRLAASVAARQLLDLMN